MYFLAMAMWLAKSLLLGNTGSLFGNVAAWRFDADQLINADLTSTVLSNPVIRKDIFVESRKVKSETQVMLPSMRDIGQRTQKSGWGWVFGTEGILDGAGLANVGQKRDRMVLEPGILLTERDFGWNDIANPANA